MLSTEASPLESHHPHPCSGTPLWVKQLESDLGGTEMAAALESTLALSYGPGQTSCW
jgi:hypothetical protein